MSGERPALATGQRVLIEIDGTETEWIALGRCENGWNFGRDDLLLWIRDVSQVEHVRLAPKPTMVEPMRWGDQVTDDSGDWLRIVEGDVHWRPWLSRLGARRSWGAMVNPRSYERDDK